MPTSLHAEQLTLPRGLTNSADFRSISHHVPLMTLHHVLILQRYNPVFIRFPGRRRLKTDAQEQLNGRPDPQQNVTHFRDIKYCRSEDITPGISRDFSDQGALPASIG